MSAPPHARRVALQRLGALCGARLAPGGVPIALARSLRLCGAVGPVAGLATVARPALATQDGAASANGHNHDHGHRHRAGCPRSSGSSTADQSAAAPAWPAWQRFQQELISADGRVIDPGDGRTVSEGQAYALFFALVANDRSAFDRLLAWTENNLAGGDLGARLPAWHWGRDPQGRWQVLDGNAASDADLWLAYTLAQAGRLWQRPALRDKAGQLAALIAEQEWAELPGTGLQLLPGPFGFAYQDASLRLNPSYVPLPVLRWHARHAARPPAGPGWGELLQGSLALLQQSAPNGLAPDWVHLPARGARAQAARQRASDSPRAVAPGALSAEQKQGGYDAIRVYLWLGLTAREDPDIADLLHRYGAVCEVVERLGDAPLRVDPSRSARLQHPRPGPRGFAAALLPLALSTGRERCAATLRARLAREAADPRAYYDSVLTLFGLGHVEGRYHFEADGSLTPAWSNTAC